jgi:hypothetical protein
MEPNLSADKKYWIVQSFAAIVISDRGTVFNSTISGKGVGRGEGHEKSTEKKLQVLVCVSGSSERKFSLKRDMRKTKRKVEPTFIFVKYRVSTKEIYTFEVIQKTNSVYLRLHTNTSR